MISSQGSRRLYRRIVFLIAGLYTIIKLSQNNNYYGEIQEKLAAPKTESGEQDLQLSHAMPEKLDSADANNESNVMLHLKQDLQLTHPLSEKLDSADANNESNLMLHLNPQEMYLPVPVIVMGLPKAGTTTIAAYFQCGFAPEYRHRVSHYDCNANPHPIEYQFHGARTGCGVAMSNNFGRKDSLFQGINHFDVYGELDVIHNHSLFFPQIRYIDHIYKAYPNSTWILNLRNVTEWVKSVTRTGLRRKVANSKRFHPRFWNNRNLNNGTVEDWELETFFDRYADFVREKARKYSSIHLVEVSIDNPTAGELMEQSFGLSRDCWGQKNVNRTF